MNAEAEPHPELAELSRLLVGTWRVDGPDISGRAEYRSTQGGRVLVVFVDFQVRDTRMRVIQQITYDLALGSLQARYLDTMGDEATYTWVLDGRKIRVSLGEKESDTYFQATLNEDSTRYVGTWRYPDEDPTGEADDIIYTRLSDDG